MPMRFVDLFALLFTLAALAAAGKAVWTLAEMAMGALL